MKKQGIGLIEVVVTILLISFLLASFTASFSALPLSQRNKHFHQAYRLAQEQLDILKSVPFPNLSNQTDGPARFVGYTVGKIAVKNDGAAFSPAQILELSNSATANPFSSLGLLPQNRYDDFDITTRLKIKNGSPASTAAGMVLRYQDSQNYYWLFIDSTGLYFRKVINGVTSNLYSQSLAINFENWYQLRAVATAANWQIYFDDLLLTTISDPDIDFGLIGLALTQGGTGHFDSLTVAAANPGIWNFDSDPINQLPAGWARFGLNDLPAGNLKLSIENYLSSDKIKKATVKISWAEKTASPEIKLVTLITND